MYSEEAENYKTEVGYRIRNLRLEAGISTEEFADILDISPAFVGAIERGQRGASIKKLIQISKIFNVSTDYLILGKKDENEEIYYKSHEEKIIEKINILMKGFESDKLIFLHTVVKELRKVSNKNLIIK